MQGMTGVDQPLGILSPELIDAMYMTRIVRALGYDATVTAVQLRPIGTGQMADSFRVTLTYSDGANGAPLSMVGKFPSADASSRTNARMWGAYLREVGFYQKIASSAGIRTPRHYHAEIDRDSHDFTLLLEDMTPAHQGDQLAGLTLEQARAVLYQASKLHASHWENARLDTLPWIDGTAQAPALFTQAFVTQMWQLFRERYGDLIDSDIVGVGTVLVANFDQWLNGYRGPRCLVHNDFRADNLLFGQAVTGELAVTTIDWQSLAFRSCMMDVSYFLGGSLPVELRRNQERELLREYHDALRMHGVRDYKFAQLWSDYVRHSFWLFLVSFVAAVGVKRTERGDRMFMSMVRSSTQQVLDHAAINSLDF